eukprot:TRINITY_DN172_c0_g1_i1.p1 TRINITY_DN172_c0_g1~~TRINITY_DN172_c0_g1_i1.p1  ORF type:complete len:352 (-),score=67.68 TRINITY_DN172_c0_g1_i1:46-1074(-)
MSKVEEMVDKINELKSSLHSAGLSSIDTTLVEYADAHNLTVPRKPLKLKRTLKGHAAKIHDMEFCENQPDLLLSASQDGKLIVWNAPTTHKVYVVPLQSQWVLTAGISTNGNCVASGGLDNTVSLYPLQEEEPIPTLSAELKGHEGSISKIRFLTDDKVLSCSGDATIKQWNCGTEACERTYSAHTKDVTCVSVSKDRNSFVTGSIDRSAYLWDSRTGDPVMCFTGHDSDINCISFFPNDEAFITGSDDGTLRLYDLRGDRTLQLYTQPEDDDSYRILSVAFSSSGKYMYTANHNYCYVWNTLTGEIAQSLPHDEFVSAVASPSDGSCVATGCWDSNLKVFL